MGKQTNTTIDHNLLDNLLHSSKETKPSFAGIYESYDMIYCGFVLVGRVFNSYC